ncbi:MAG: SMC-Scp complex subunit ScpB [Micrococcales bacterium]|nr:SMC-Scp complex subunit ScpB [Micrococcales bacterium]
MNRTEGGPVFLAAGQAKPGPDPDQDQVQVQADPDQDQAAEEAFSEPIPEAQARAALEAILMVVDQPAPTRDLAMAIGWPTAETTQLLENLAAEYSGVDSQPARGFQLREVAGGWRYYSHPDQAQVVGAFVQGGATAKLTGAALETLAVVAYKGPLSRGQIAAVRGVSVDSVVRTLVSRGLIEEVGTEPTTGAVLFATTAFFLEAMGLASLDQLEPLAPYLPAGEELLQLQEQVEPNEPNQAAP